MHDNDCLETGNNPPSHIIMIAPTLIHELSEARQRDLLQFKIFNEYELQITFYGVSQTTVERIQQYIQTHYDYRTTLFIDYSISTVMVYTYSTIKLNPPVL